MHQKEWENKSGKTSQHFLSLVRIKLLRKKSLHIFRTERVFFGKRNNPMKFSVLYSHLSFAFVSSREKKPLMLKIASFMNESILNASLFTDV